MAKGGMSTYLFPIGVLLALVGAFITNEWIPILMGVIGLLVGFLNFKKAETTKGLLFVIALGMTGVTTGILGGLGQIGGILEPILLNLASFFGFAAVAMVLSAGFRILKN